MITFSHAILAYDLTLIAVYSLDFIVRSRRNDTVVAKAPAIAMLVLLSWPRSAQSGTTSPPCWPGC